MACLPLKSNAFSFGPSHGGSGTRSALDRGQSGYIVVVQHRNQAADGVDVENCDQPAVSGKVSKGRCQRKT